MFEYEQMFEYEHMFVFVLMRMQNFNKKCKIFAGRLENMFATYHENWSRIDREKQRKTCAVISSHCSADYDYSLRTRRILGRNYRIR